MCAVRYELANARYDTAELVRAGNGVRTLRGCDVETGEEVVIKVANLATVSSDERERVELEWQAFQGRACPWFAPPNHWGVQDESFLIVTPRVPGESLDRRLERGPLGAVSAISVARSLLLALKITHGAALCHLDIRPSKVMVGESLPVPQAVLLSGALSRSRRFEPSQETPAPEFLRYVSPEQAGLINRPIDQRSDLYSVGVVLYACLAGRPPHEGPGVADLLHQHVVCSPPPLNGLALGVPRVLDELVQRLLRKDPDDRYQSCEAVVCDLDAIEAAMASGSPEPAIALGRRDARKRLTDPSLVGRTRELEVVDARLDQTANGRGGLVLVEGESGCGKSRLLQEVGARAAARGMLVLHGARLDPEQRLPLQLFSGLVDALVERSGRDDGHVKALLAQLGSERADLARILPDLAGILGQTDAEPAGPDKYGRGRSVRALGTLLAGLGTVRRPAVVIFDDCQWADDLTMESLVLQAFPSEMYVLIAAAFRSDDIDDNHPLRRAEPSARLVLSRLSPDEVVEVAESMAGPLPAAAIEMVERWSQGNPFMVGAILWGIAESGELAPHGQGWRFEAASRAGAQVGEEAAVVLAQRLSRLTRPTRELLAAGAVLGKRFDLFLAAQVAGQRAEEARVAVQEAERARIAWGLPGAREFAFLHDRLRETVLHGLGEDVRSRLHGAAAAVLESIDPSRAFDLAYHFDAAGATEQALAYALPAAREARVRFALDVAAQMYEIVWRSAGACPSDLRRQVAGELGEVLKLSGRYEEAAYYVGRARSDAEDTRAAAWAEAELGELALKQGDARKASEHLEGAIRLCGGRLPRRTASLLLMLVWELGVQALMPVRLIRRCRKAQQNDRIFLAHLYGRLVYPLWFNQSTLATLWVQLRQLNLAERYPQSAELGLAYAIHGAATAAAFPFLWRRGLDRVDRSLAIRQALRDPWGQGQSLSYRGAVLHAGGRYREALVSLEEAERLLERTGDPWEVNLARWHRALCLYRLGELREAVAVCKAIYRTASAIGDREAVGAALEIWAKATGGHLPGELTTASSPSDDDDVQTTVSLLQGQAVCLLAENRAGEATICLEKARRVALDARLVNPYTATTQPWLLTALRCTAEQSSPFGLHNRRRLLKRAGRAAALARIVATVFRNDRPHALREAGLIAALRNQEGRAHRLLTRSVTVARRQESPYECAQSLRALAKVGLAAGWPEAAESQAAAEAASETIALPSEATGPDTVSWDLGAVSLAQRYEAILGAGRRIASATSRHEVITALQESATILLRAEDIAVLALDDKLGERRDDAIMAGLHLGQPQHDDTHFIQLALRIHYPVVANEPSSEERRGGHLISPRSALFAPVIVRGRAVACLRSTHRTVDGLFGAEEKHLAMFLSTLAGAALERAWLQEEMMERVIGAQEAERSRVARDLHDEIGQGLTLLLLALRPVEASLRAASPEADGVPGETAELRDMINALLAEVRRLAFELRPTVLDDLGLGAALSRLANDVSTRHRMVVDVAAADLTSLGRLSPRVESTVYRVAQEALTNVVRHSHAASCSVVVRREGARLRMVIEDEGIGFDPNGEMLESLGLRGMKERASLLGGSLRVLSQPGNGASVILDVPIA